jgi:hypothetical protein
MNFGLGHGSRHPVPNVKCVTLGPNLPWEVPKGRIFENFRLECRIFESVTSKFVGYRSAESVFWVTGHNPCRIEWNCTVYLCSMHPNSIHFNFASSYELPEQSGGASCNSLLSDWRWTNQKEKAIRRDKQRHRSRYPFRTIVEQMQMAYLTGAVAAATSQMLTQMLGQHPYHLVVPKNPWLTIEHWNVLAL